MLRKCLIILAVTLLSLGAREARFPNIVPEAKEAITRTAEHEAVVTSNVTIIQEPTGQSLSEKNPTDLLLDFLRQTLIAFMDTKLNLKDSLSDWLRWAVIQFLRPFGLIQEIPRSSGTGSIDRSDVITTEEVLIVPVVGTPIRFGELERAEKFIMEAIEAVRVWQKRREYSALDIKDQANSSTT